MLLYLNKRSKVNSLGRQQGWILTVHSLNCWTLTMIACLTMKMFHWPLTFSGYQKRLSRFSTEPFKWIQMVEESEKAGSCQESNPGHLWFEPSLLCHWATTAGWPPGCRGSVAEHWQLKPEVSWVRPMRRSFLRKTVPGSSKKRERWWTIHVNISSKKWKAYKKL